MLWEKTKFKKLADSIHKEHYDRMHQKLNQNPEYTKKMVRVRSKTDKFTQNLFLRNQKRVFKPLYFFKISM